MAADPSIGMVFPDDANIVGWTKNRPYAEELGNQLGINALPENFLFPIGTMFWARVKALAPLFEMNMDWQDYPAEPLPYDGTLLHAIERLLPFVAAKQGFRLVLTYAKGMTR
jgi:lipopolysaccharide biosynthesis protein